MYVHICICACVCAFTSCTCTSKNIQPLFIYTLIDQHHSASMSDALSGSADSGISISKESVSVSIENEIEVVPLTSCLQLIFFDYTGTKKAPSKNGFQKKKDKKFALID